MGGTKFKHRYKGGRTIFDWLSIGGGDGFHAQADPTDPSIVYSESQNGGIRRINPKTGESRSARPRPTTPDEVLRFDWKHALPHLLL